MPTIYGNDIFSCEYGIYCMHTSPNIISSIITNCTYDIYLNNSVGILKDCSCYSGIYITAESNPIIIHCHYNRHKIITESEIDNDYDGIIDTNELFKYELNPYINDSIADTDGDSLTNIFEVEVPHTDPIMNDTDMDGITDDIETADGTIIWYEAED
jgi:hypothetical protein